MGKETRMNTSPMRSTSAVAPVVMSLAALALVLIHVARYGLVHEADEGTSAHLFQLLMVLQVPVIAFFAIKWLPQAPGKALVVLAAQFLTALAAFAALFAMESLS
jgi:hypothetical protein